MPDSAYRDLTEEEISFYQKEGAVLVPQCVDSKWLERMTKAIESATCLAQQMGA